MAFISITEQSCTADPQYRASAKSCKDISGADEVFNRIEDYISDWESLGAKLDMSVTKLERIDRDENDSSHQLRAMLQLWYDSSPKRCWEHVIQALIDIDKVKLASQIAGERQIDWKQFTF